MNMVIPNEGDLAWAIFLSQGSIWGDIVNNIALYKNDITPTAGSVLADFTEADFGGYASILVGANWGSDIGTDGRGFMYFANSTLFAQTSGPDQTVYGWYLWSYDFNCVMAAQRFDAPRLMTVGATLDLTPFRIRIGTFTG